MRTLRVILACAALLATAGISPADDVILKDGRRFSGEIVKETADTVVIKTVGGQMEFRRSEVLQLAWKTDPRKIYRQKSDALDTKSVASRLELARWCVAQGLEAEARRELELVLIADPQNADAHELLKKVTRSTGTAVPLRVEVTLTDGSQVKGRLINTVFTIETPYGILHVPASSVSAVLVGEEKNPDTIETAAFKAKGQLAEELFVVDSKLGRLTIARKDVRGLTIYQPTAAELAELEFNETMRQYNYLGFDVVFVVDATDSMTGPLLHLRRGSKLLAETVRRFVPNAQFGLVAYRDHKAFDPAEFTWVTQLTPLGAKDDDFLKAVDELRAAGGGDIPDAVFDGLSEAMTRAAWRPKGYRLIVLIGDAPPHLENAGLKKTLALVSDWHKNTQGVVHVVDCTGYNRLMEEFRSIAEAGGGKSLALADETALVRELFPLILGSDWRDRLLKAWDEAAAPKPPPEE